MFAEGRAVPVLGCSAHHSPNHLSGRDPVCDPGHNAGLPAESQHSCGEVGWREDLSADAGVYDRGLLQHLVSLQQAIPRRLPPQTAPFCH